MILRWIEFVSLFVVLPAVYVGGWRPLPVMAMLVAIGLYCGARLLTDPTFERKPLREPPQTRGLWLPWLAAIMVLAPFVWWVYPGRWLELPRLYPRIWVLVMILYPLASVVAQEMIYRVFFFHRFAPLFRHPRVLIVVSSLLFGLHHALFGNALAVVLSTLGGFKFAATYRRTGSYWTVCIEHALYGCAIFTLGLGRFFYAGTLHTASTILTR